MKTVPGLRRTFRAAPAIGGAICAALLIHGLTDASALPTTSPAWRGAAQLRYYPPAGWIRHYLGDDRYKIVGGNWKVVSTQYDVYYHRANCPNMLRQSPGIVIGFNTHKDARDAGYKPDSVCSPDSEGVMYMAAPRAGQTSTGGRDSLRVGGVTVKGIRTTLSDGSSILLPTGWTLRRGGMQKGRGGAMVIDMMSPKSEPLNYVMYLNATAPGTNLEAMTNVATARKQAKERAQAFKNMNAKSGNSNARFSNIFKSFEQESKVSAARFAGLNGIRVESPGSGTTPGSMSISAARGSTIYSLSMNNKIARQPAGRAIISSFQRR